MRNFRLAFVLFICLFSLNILAHENHEQCFQKHTEKMYVTLDKLVFGEHEIYLLDDGTIEPIKAVYVDPKGYFIKIDSKKAKKNNERIGENTCINGHPIYHQECRGCAHPWCNSRCKCYMPWNH